MSNSRHIGTLIVVILKARNLPNKRHIGKQDPYCQVIFNGEKRRTKAIKRGGQHPEWDEEIRFELYEDTEDIPHIPELNGDGPPPPPPPKSNSKGPPKVKGGKYMALACYAEDPREPDLIGETKVDLTEVLTKGETDEWFTVMNKDKYCGEVYLELTFWLDEPPPTKKVTPKANGQYGGRGTFVPIGDSASSSLSDLDRYSVSSRLSASSAEIRRENLPPSLRSSNSRLDIYVAPYESTRSHNSSVDGMVNEFAELRVEPGGNRRQSMPAQMGSYLPRPASSLGLPTPAAYTNGVAQVHHQSTYSDGGSSYQYDYTKGPQPYHHDSAPLPDPYQPAYEQNPAPTGFQPPQHGRPRYSMPATSSGFVPLPTPAPSGFMPLSPSLPQPSGFLPAPSATPAPYGAPVTPTRVPSSSFSTLPPPPVAPSGFVPSNQQPPPTSSFPSCFTPSSSQYYPAAQNTPPAAPYSQHGQHSPSAYPQQGSPLPPSSSYPQNPPAPSSSYPQNLPTSSFPQNTPPHGSYPQHPPPPPSSAPPQTQQPPYPHSPSTPVIPHAQSAPPEQQQYANQLTSSPGHENIPPPPPLTESPSKGPPPGSRPLPQPQAQPQSQQFSQHARRQSSLPIPPPSSQGYYNGTQNQPAFPAPMNYQSIPPPPPLPQQPQQQTQPQSSFPQNGQQLGLPGPPPPLPSSQPPYSQTQTSAPPKRRPSLPPPPIGFQNQQPSAYQSLPPPPPPPSLPSHLQYEPASSFAPSAQGQSYYPGPPPRPPQYLPANGAPQAHGGYSPPIPQGQEYDPYGR